MEAARSAGCGWLKLNTNQVHFCNANKSSVKALRGRQIQQGEIPGEFKRYRAGVQTIFNLAEKQ